MAGCGTGRPEDLRAEIVVVEVPVPVEMLICQVVNLAPFVLVVVVQYNSVQSIPSSTSHFCLVSKLPNDWKHASKKPAKPDSILL